MRNWSWKVTAILIETSTEHSRLPSDCDSDCTEIRLVVRGCRLHPIHCGNGGLVTSLYQWSGETRQHQHYQPPTQTGEDINVTHHHHHIVSLTTPTSPHPPYLVPQQPHTWGFLPVSRYPAAPASFELISVRIQTEPTVI